VDSTFDEARRCPACKEPGRRSYTQPQADGSKVETYMCDNARCEFSEVGWIIQVLPDGSVAPKRSQAELRANKNFPLLTPGQEARARATLEEARGY
jgi:hypothetical protein